MASVLILYGSQTGNAQDVAERMSRECKQLGYAPRVLAMDGYPITQLPQENIVLFAVSTTGQGELPENMRASWRFLLRKSLAPTSLSTTMYAVFGLGDSGYVKYNVAAKKLHRRLAGLGAVPMLECGLGDDQHPSGYEAALDPWLQLLWAKLQHQLPMHQAPLSAAAARSATSKALVGSKYRVKVLPREQWEPPPSDAQEALDRAVAAAVAFRAVQQYAAGMPPGSPQQPASLLPAPSHPYGPWRPFMAPLLTNTRITSPTHFQDTRHIELDLRGSGLETYSPGDVLAIFPHPSPAIVDSFLERVGWEGSCTVAVEAADPPMQLPEGTEAPTLVASLRSIAQGVLDVGGGSPRRYLFQLLQHFVASSMERDRLLYFGSAAGRDDLYKYNQREGRTLLEVLQDFRSASPPLGILLEAAPLLRPRLFSLASSPLAHPGQAHITLAVVDYTTPYKRRKKGLCSDWLAGLAPGGPNGGVKVPVWVEKGAMHLPASLQVPLIMVGPGTGVAPFRAFLHHRKALALPVSGPAAHPAGALASSMLFFGCRSQTADFYYQNDWQQLQASGVLHPKHGLVTAFSRDTAEKVYVQDNIRAHGREVWGLLKEGAVVYVCGSAQKMPAAVAKAFQQVVEEEGGLGGEAASRWVKQLELTGRYHVEAWS